MQNSFRVKYLVFIISIISGYFLLFHYSTSLQGHTTCPFKLITGFPCPACGSTRATIQILHGNLRKSIFINPLGLVTNILIMAFLFWMVIDIVRNRETFLPFLRKDWNNYCKMVFIVIMLVNWIWNIKKGL